MKATDMLNKVKEVLGVELSEENEIKLAQATLENGTIIEAEEFAEGKEVFIVTEDEKVALPVGSYKLDDGQELIIEEEGIIKSIGEAVEAPEEHAGVLLPGRAVSGARRVLLPQGHVQQGSSHSVCAVVSVE